MARGGAARAEAPKASASDRYASLSRHAERLPQHHGRLRAGPAGHRGRVTSAEPWKVPGNWCSSTETPACRSALGVGDSLVTQRVVLGGRDVGRRQAREVGGAGRRRVGRHSVGPVQVAEVGLPALHGERPVPQRASRRTPHGRRVSRRSSSSGMCSIWKQTGGPPRSRASNAVAAASPPPALGAGDGDPRRVDARARRPRRGGTTARRSSRAARPGTGARAPAGSRPTRRTAPASMAMSAAPTCSASTLPITKPPPWIMTMPGHRAAAGGPVGPVDAHRHVGVALPSRHQAVLDVERLDPGDVDPDGDEHLLEGLPRRHGVRRGRSPAASRPWPPAPGRSSGASPRCSSYFGCIRMPASMRIDSAFMYEFGQQLDGQRGELRRVARDGAGRARPGPACP